MAIQVGSGNTENNGTLNNISNLLRSCLGWLGQAPDASGRMRVSVDAGTLPTVTTVGTVTTVTTVTTVSTVSNMSQIGGIAATDHVPALMALAAQGNRSRIIVS